MSWISWISSAQRLHRLSEPVHLILVGLHRGTHAELGLDDRLSSVPDEVGAGPAPYYVDNVQRLVRWRASRLRPCTGAQLSMLVACECRDHPDSSTPTTATFDVIMSGFTSP